MTSCAGPRAKAGRAVPLSAFNRMPGNRMPGPRMNSMGEFDG